MLLQLPKTKLIRASIMRLLQLQSHKHIPGSSLLGALHVPNDSDFRGHHDNVGACAPTCGEDKLETQSRHMAYTNTSANVALLLKSSRTVHPTSVVCKTSQDKAAA